jgi:hypothetical protein
MYGKCVQEQGSEKVFGPKKDMVTGEWNDYKMKSFTICTPHEILFRRSRMRSAGHVTCMGERRGTYRILVGRPDGNFVLIYAFCFNLYCGGFILFCKCVYEWIL